MKVNQIQEPNARQPRKSPFSDQEKLLVEQAAARIHAAGYPPLSAAQARVIRRTYGRLLTAPTVPAVETGKR